MTVGDGVAVRRNQVPLGIAYMVGSTVMFAGGNAVVKWQLATYPLGEVAFGRTLFAFLTVAAIVLRGRRRSDPTLPRASAARAVAVRFHAVLVPRGQRSVAWLGDGARLCGAFVH